MPAEISSEVRGAILAPIQNGQSCHKIAALLTDMGMTASHTKVAKVKKEAEAERLGVPKKPKKLGTQCRPTRKRMEVAKKVAQEIYCANPPAIRQLAHKHGVSDYMIRKIISENCDAELRNKFKVHALSHRQALQRMERGPRFRKYLTGQKWKYIMTIDEAWVYTTSVNGVRKVYYRFRGRENPESWQKNGRRSILMASCSQLE